MKEEETIITVENGIEINDYILIKKHYENTIGKMLIRSLKNEKAEPFSIYLEQKDCDKMLDGEKIEYLPNNFMSIRKNLVKTLEYKINETLIKHNVFIPSNKTDEVIKEIIKIINKHKNQKL